MLEWAREAVACRLDFGAWFNFFARTPAGKGSAPDLQSRFLAGEEFSGIEVEMRRVDGRPLWISLWMKPIRGAKWVFVILHGCHREAHRPLRACRRRHHLPR